MAKPTQTRRQFLKDFVGPPRRPRTAEERAAAMAAYERAMATWRAECGDIAKRKNNFHRIADAEEGRGVSGGPVGLSVDPDLLRRHVQALRDADVMRVSLPAPTRSARVGFLLHVDSTSKQIHSPRASLIKQSGGANASEIDC